MPSKITSDLSFGLQFDLVNTNYINVKLLDFVSCLRFKRIHFREIYNVENYGKEPWISSCGRIKNDPKLGFNPWIGKISGRREWIPTPVFLPGESHGQRNLVGCSPLGYKRVGHNWESNILLFLMYGTKTVVAYSYKDFWLTLLIALCVSNKLSNSKSGSLYLYESNHLGTRLGFALC